MANSEQSIFRRVSAGCGFAIFWVLATAIGAAIGGSLGGLSGRSVALGLLADSSDPSQRVPAGLLLGAVGIIVAAFILGLLQRIVLRRLAPKARWWLLSNVVGWTLAVGLSIPVLTFVPRLVEERAVGATSGALVGVLAGLVLGLTQWLILRAHVRRAGCWVPLSVVGWGFGLGVLGATGENSMTGILVNLTIVGALVGVITGPPLAILLQQRKQPKDAPQ